MKRERVELIIDIIEAYDEEDDLTEEAEFLEEVKDKCRDFKIKYEYLDKYGVDIALNDIHKDFIRISRRYGDIYIRKVGEVYHSENQPKNEKLMVYDMRGGSYIFGGGSEDNYHDIELFEMFFNELKKYKYSYIDEVNHMIYFKVKEGMKLYKEYPSICSKYQDLFNARWKEAKAKKLRDELEELEKGDEQVKCQYCNKVNCDDVEERDFDYYTCDKMNDLDLKEYGKYDSLDNEVDEDNCKYYLCDTCEFKIELEKKEN